MFHAAQARATADSKVEVWSDKVNIPTAVRYGWADNPECSLKTQSGQRVPPFRTDVAMMGKLGFDIKLTDMSGDELTYCQQAIKNYKRLRPAIMEGDMYRLVSPYSGNHAATQFVAKGANKAVVFAFDVYPAYGEHRTPIRLEGLNPDKLYKVTEINMMPGQGSWFEGSGQTFSGDYLMTAGLNLFTGNKLYSRVIEITAE